MTRPSSAAANDAESSHPMERDLNWLLHRVALGLGDAEQRAMAAQGIGVREHVVLSALAHSGPMRQLDLAHTLRLDKSAMTAVLDGLVRKGLVERHEDPEDRRARLPVLTAKGREVQRAAAAAAAIVEEELISDLTPRERASLVLLLRRLAFGRIADSPDTGGSCL